MEIKAALAEKGVGVGIGTLWRFLDRRRITPNKDGACGRAGAPRRPEAARGWFGGQLDLDADRLVIIDETWASTNMARRRARAVVRSPSIWVPPPLSPERDPP